MYGFVKEITRKGIEREKSWPLAKNDAKAKCECSEWVKGDGDL